MAELTADLIAIVAHYTTLPATFSLIGCSKEFARRAVELPWLWRQKTLSERRGLVVDDSVVTNWARYYARVNRTYWGEVRYQKGAIWNKLLGIGPVIFAKVSEPSQTECEAIFQASDYSITYADYRGDYHQVTGIKSRLIDAILNLNKLFLLTERGDIWQANYTSSSRTDQWDQTRQVLTKMIGKLGHSQPDEDPVEMMYEKFYSSMAEVRSTEFDLQTINTKPSRPIGGVCILSGKEFVNIDDSVMLHRSGKVAYREKQLVRYSKLPVRVVELTWCTSSAIAAIATAGGVGYRIILRDIPSMTQTIGRPRSGPYTGEIISPTLILGGTFEYSSEEPVKDSGWSQYYAHGPSDFKLVIN